MTEGTTKYRTWTQEKFERFKDAYARANAESAKSFKFEGDEFITGYAKFLIQYLEGTFK